MNIPDHTDIALPLSPVISQLNGDDHAVMPAGFAGMYQAGFEAGYRAGREVGYQQRFKESIAAAQLGPLDGAAIKTVIESKPAPKVGPRRILLGMPCKRCRVYLMSDETSCPCCKQPLREV